MIGWKPVSFIFIHIPKCAGTSIEKAFIPILTQHNAFHELTLKERRLYWLPVRGGLQHSKLRAYDRRFKVDDFFKFSFVRNPWDRAVSQINYLRSVACAPFLQGKTFKQQVKAYCNSTARIWGHDLGACQLDYLVGDSGEVKMDFIGRFESLLEDFSAVCRQIGIKPVPELPHIFNSRRKTHYSAFYDAESADFVRNQFAKDIDYFGYKFENMVSPMTIGNPKSHRQVVAKEAIASTVVK